MSRTVLSYHVADITALAKSLRGQLAEQPTPPGHLTLLNMLARAAGFRNFQHFRAVGLPEAFQAGASAASAPGAAAPAEPVAPALDQRALNRMARYFDPQGRLLRWPGKFSHRLPCLWVLWAGLPAKQVFDEYGITRWLDAQSAFGDPALLRRELCDQGLMSRTRDGREYRRVEQRPSPEGLALIKAVGASPREA